MDKRDISIRKLTKSEFELPKDALFFVVSTQIIKLLHIYLIYG